MKWARSGRRVFSGWRGCRCPKTGMASAATRCEIVRELPRPSAESMGSLFSYHRSYHRPLGNAATARSRHRSIRRPTSGRQPCAKPHTRRPQRRSPRVAVVRCGSALLCVRVCPPKRKTRQWPSRSVRRRGHQRDLGSDLCVYNLAGHDGSDGTPRSEEFVPTELCPGA
jgi:hypothetical protein